MQYIPIKTRVLQPPYDDLLAALDVALTDVRERDIVLISSKVVAIHQGRCVPIASADKRALVEQEADILIPADYRTQPLTVKHHTFLGGAGIDESNGDGHYVLLPEKPFDAAAMVHAYLTQRFALREVGVIITDSRSYLFRFGATGVALAYWGIHPLEDHAGKRDLFGRAMRVERSNLVDGLAAAAAVVGGEVAEATPVVIAREVPNVRYEEGNFKDELMVEPKDDFFRVLYEQFLK